LKRGAFFERAGDLKNAALKGRGFPAAPQVPQKQSTAASQFAEKLNCGSVLKGRGFFSRAVSAAKSTLALATEVTSGLRSDSFSNLFSRWGDSPGLARVDLPV
jgi:hypothetical protein